MIYNDIKDVMEKHFSISFDTDLYKQIKQFRINWMQKSPDYVNFLSGKYLGVHRIAFSEEDDRRLMADIFKVDRNSLFSDIRNVRGIDPKWNVVTQPVTNALLYSMYMFHKSKEINQKDKEAAITELYLIYAYKTMGALLYSHFGDYRTPEAVASAVVEQMSARYLIRKMDNWQAVFVYKAKDFTDKKGTHYERITNYNTKNVVRILGDLRSNLHSMVKYIHQLTQDVIDNGDAIRKSTILEDSEEGGMAIKDITTRPDTYVTYLYGIINKENDFIKEDLLYLLKNYMGQLDTAILKSVLKELSAVNFKPHSKDDIYEKIINISIEFINSKNLSYNYSADIETIIKGLYNYYSSSRVTNKEVIEIKQYLSKLVIKLSNKKTRWVISTVVIGLMIYIFTRAVAKDKI